MSIFEYDHEEELKKLGAMEREEGVCRGTRPGYSIAAQPSRSVPEWLRKRILIERDTLF